MKTVERTPAAELNSYCSGLRLIGARCARLIRRCRGGCGRYRGVCTRIEIRRRAASLLTAQVVHRFYQVAGAVSDEDFLFTHVYNIQRTPLEVNKQVLRLTGYKGPIPTKSASLNYVSRPFRDLSLTFSSWEGNYYAQEGESTATSASAGLERCPR